MATLQRAATKPAPVNGAPPIVHEVLHSPGQPLDAGTRAFMEPRFGFDFSHVRVHNDAQAAQNARAVSAQAYTVGQDVVFAADQYEPNRAEGARLLAHELTHVVQQAGGHGIPSSLLQRQPAPAPTRQGRILSLKEISADPAREKARKKTGQTAAKVCRSFSAGAGNENCPATLEPGLQVTIVAEKAGGAWLQIVVAEQIPGFGPKEPLYVMAAFVEELQTANAPEKGSQTSSPTAHLAEARQDPTTGLSDEDLAQAGLIATGRVLERQLAPEAKALRAIYNEGAARIAAERARLVAQGLPEAEVAQRLAAMRHQLAKDVRRAGSALLRRGAEAYDAVRGNVGRPTYEMLKAAGKTDAEIIQSASRTNTFINRLPTGLKWTGRSLLIVSVGISIYVIVSAPPDQQRAVAEREIGGLVGGVAGAEIGAGVCILVGIATEGLGLVVCGLLGGIAGTEAGRRLPLLQILDIAPHHVPELAGRLFRVEGSWEEIDLFILSIPRRTVSAAENVLVVATGQVSGEMVGGRGHYRMSQVIPANDDATRLFGDIDARFVPQYLLLPASHEDLRRSGER